MSRMERKAMSRHRPNNSGSSISSSDGSSFDGHSYAEERDLVASRRMLRKASEPTLPLNARMPMPMEKVYSDAPSMARMESNDSYRMPWSTRRSEVDADIDADESFGCSLSHEFDRMRRQTDDYAAGDLSMTPQKHQVWLDSTFERLSMKHRSQPLPQKGERDGHGKVKAAKPHFLDLSCIISPVPLDVTTPPANVLNRQVSLDMTTPRPSFAQRFTSDGTGTEPTPLRQALQPSLAANGVAPAHRGLRGKASQDSLRSAVSSASSAQQRQSLRIRRSFDNPGEMRRRQKDEWSQQNSYGAECSVVPQLPDWAHRQNRANNVSGFHHAKKPSDPFWQHDATVASAVPSGLRSSPMARGVSHDTGMPSQPPTPTRPRLGSRSSSSMLRYRMDRSNVYGAEALSPVSPSFPPMPPLTTSRGSFGSSTGSDSMPHTPSSATFSRALLAAPSKGSAYPAPYPHFDGKEYVQDVVAPLSFSHAASSQLPALPPKNSHAADEGSLLSPPRSSSLRRDLCDAGDVLDSQASSLPYAQGELSPRQQQRPQHASWGSASRYSNEDDEGSSAYSADTMTESSAPQGSPRMVRVMTPTYAPDPMGNMASKWSPSTPVLPLTGNGRSRANSRADEWAANIGRRFAKGINARAA
ncbi:hypothetical protein ACQY0O_001604 [Thecaphora frezii]